MKRSAALHLVLPASALVLAAVSLSAHGEGASAPEVPAAALAAPPDPTPPPRIGPMHLDPALGRYVAPLGAGRAILTIDPRLQARLERHLASWAVPWGATVVLEPSTGRILAMAEHSQAEPGARDLALRALAPAASIFKIVTAAALLEQGVSPDEEVCYHGGRHRLQPRLLSDDPRRDRRCRSLSDALGHSTNVVFAKLADRGLSAEVLRATAERFLWNAEIPFPREVEPSPAEFSQDPFELAKTAAGFGPVKLSPLHAALVTATVANGGVLVPPALVEDAEGAAAPVPAPPRRVVDEAVAAELAEMMRTTVTTGTARRAFRRGGGSLRDVSVAGKTGSLADKEPYRDYSWFVGFAPVDHPEVVVATVIVNGKLWRVKAPTVAKEALAAYFEARVADGRAPGARRTAFNGAFRPGPNP